MSSSFSLNTNSTKISNLLESLSSSSPDFKLVIRSPTTYEIESDSTTFDHKVDPPLVVEMSNRLFPAFAVMRNKKQQLLVPSFGARTIDDDDEREEDLIPASIDDVLYRVVADDFCRCIVIAESSSQLIELTNQNVRVVDEISEKTSENVFYYYYFPESTKFKTKNILLSEKEKQILSVKIFDQRQGEERNVMMMNEEIRRQQQEIIRRVNGQIIDGAASVLNSGVSADRLAQIYDEVDSRREKILKTRSVGGRQHKDVKTVVVPMKKSEDGTVNEGLMQISFTTTATS